MAAINLAIALGCLDVDLMLDQMTSAQFQEYLTFFAINPFGPVAKTTRFAAQCANTLNAPHWQTKKPRKYQEFLPHQPKKPEQSIAEQIAIMKQFS